MTTRRPLAEDLAWVLEPLLELPGVQHAVIATGDGLLEGSSPDLDRAAVIDRIVSLAASAVAAGERT